MNDKSGLEKMVEFCRKHLDTYTENEESSGRAMISMCLQKTIDLLAEEKAQKKRPCKVMPDGKNIPDEFVKKMGIAYEMDEFIVRNIIDQYHIQILCL